MTEAQDPERLLADALRAQARSSPAPEPAPEKPGYGPLSGSPQRERAAIAEPRTVRTPRPDSRNPVANRIPAYWVLLLAVLLGLATGSVIGLITLL
ncbi:hypothetical protein [Amycolatopsis pigmentata]|uniref:Uncharacterized protein n=1 Tax=Amycolatopsis pigmentata TaxID=450801 RepID=A0ABW5FTS1_9PSEU